MKRSPRRSRWPVLALLLCTPLFVSYTADGGAKPQDEAAVADAASCEAPADPSQAIQARLAGAVERARATGAAQDVIVLNGQGYNYVAGPARDLEQMQRELARQRREAGD